MKKKIMWGLSVFMLFSGVLFFPSFASIIMVLFFFIAAPIPPIQNFLYRKGLKGWVKPALLVVLFFVAAMLIPSGQSTDSDIPEQILIVSEFEESAAPTAAPSTVPSLLVATSPSPSPISISGPVVIENFVSLYNSISDLHIEQLSSFTPSDKNAACYRTEFRLNAYKNSIAKHGVIGSSNIDIIYSPGMYLNSFRIYITSENQEELESLSLLAFSVLDSNVDLSAIQASFDSMASSFYLDNITYTITKASSGNEVMIDVSDITTCPSLLNGITE